MKKSVHYFMLWFMMSISYVAYSQDAELNQIPLPPSPEVSSLGKFIDSPVDLQRGVPQISIPLANIQYKQLAAPVSLDYHAGGIRVQEVASREGLGWSLSAGGMISRSMRGLPDESAGGWLNMTPIRTFLINWNNGNPNSAGINQWDDMTGGLADTAADIFYIKVNGISAQFFYDETGYPRIYSTRRLKINQIGNLNGFEIIDEYGNRYYFGQSADGQDQAIEYNNTGSACNDAPPSYSIHNSTWHLMEITSATNDARIKFEYEPYMISYCNMAMEKKYVAFQPWCTRPDNDICYSSTTISGHRLKKIVGAQNTLEIVYGAERNDLPGDHQIDTIKVSTNQGLGINKWHLENDYFESSETGHLAFNGYCNMPDSVRKKRLKLISVQKMDGKGVESEPPYAFEYSPVNLPERFSRAQDHWGFYNGKHDNTSLIPDGWVIDSALPPDGRYYWYEGTNRSAIDSLAQACMLTGITYPTGGKTEYVFESNTVGKYQGLDHAFDTVPAFPDEGLPYTEEEQHLLVFGDFTTLYHADTFLLSNANKNDVYVDMLISNVSCELDAANGCDITFTIEGITDPTYSQQMVHKYQVGVFPPGLYRIVVDITNMQPEFENFMVNFKWKNSHVTPDIKVGGLRIAKTIQYDGIDHANDIIREYKYNVEDNTRSSGNIPFFPTYHDPLHVGDENCFLVQAKAVPNFQLGTKSGLQVEYGRVEVLYGEGGENGKEINHYSFEDPAANDYAATRFPYPASERKSWTGGQLLKKSIYEKKGNDSRLISEETTSYGSYDGSYQGYSVLTLGRFQISSLVGAGFQFAPSKEPYGLVRPDSMTRKTISYNDVAGTKDSLETHTSYKYSDTHFQIISQKTWGSDGELVEDEYRYISHYPATTDKPIWDTLYTKHNMRAVPIEKVRYVDGTLVSSTATKFSFDSTGHVFPKEFYVVDKDLNGTFSLSNDASDFTGYRKVAEYVRHDNKGNILEYVDASGVTSCYIWGHDQSLVVASIQNASFSEVETLLGTNFHAGTGGLNTTQITTLRNSLSNAFVTIYEHEPGIGLKKVIDPNGLKQEYVYDDFGRLSKVLDNDDNVLRKNTYHYKSNSQN